MPRRKTPDFLPALHASTHVGGGTDTSSSIALPAGVILMWHGLTANIPNGWLLCNGTSGTPDLRDRFVKGAPVATEAGATGGAATHTHTGHSAHAVTQPSDHAADVSGTPSATTDATLVGTAVASSTHTHTTPLLAHAGAAVDAHSAHDTPDSKPPWFEILFIMKS